MSSFKAYARKKDFFEGWYFKHQKGEDTISFIPGINIDSKGNRSAFIQVITNRNSYNINYSFSKFIVYKDKLKIKIGDSIFSSKGIEIHIKDEGLTIDGKIEYDLLTPVKYDIMGPFSFIPFMECSHGIISLYHKLNGNLIINGENISFNDGVGYIETDRGNSFPKTYLWTQCNDFKNEKISIMAAIADIPFMGINFKGCICVVYYKGREYRLSTYNGVKILKYNCKSLMLKRGKYELQIKVTDGNPQKLLAPSSGNMCRTIHENAACSANYKFYIEDKLVFDIESDNCSFEYVDR
ncbi:MULTISPECIES: tocopherol cyclase family protein [unclassified Clostridium]|uniref:tocopherol cyclase family protein n=1 Tax=unclassified Clostridium TaxID=2614128 RepID=UPI0032180303